MCIRDSFVPMERVFMCREYQFSNMLVERFAGYHRQSYGGCKVGVGLSLIHIFRRTLLLLSLPKVFRNSLVVWLSYS